MRRTTINLTESTERQVKTLRHYGTFTEIARIAIDRMYTQEIADQTRQFRLDIYTWPAMMGVDPQMRTSYHDTPESARVHVEMQTEPFYHAVLLKRFPGGHLPANWQGEAITDQKASWPHISGTNGDHPAVIALKQDWPSLVTEVRRIYAEKNGAVGMVYIAGDLLRERHPDVHGWSDQLGWAATDNGGPWRRDDDEGDDD
jgi:hypothetical protein